MTYYKIELARNSSVWEQIAEEYAAELDNVLDSYVLADDEAVCDDVDGDTVKLTLVNWNYDMGVGSARYNNNTVYAVADDNDDVWISEDTVDTLF